jgi:hypothetical protein
VKSTNHCFWFNSSINIKSMRTAFLILFLIPGVIRPLQAQTGPVASRPYRIWILPMKSARAMNGILYETRDSSVLVAATSVTSVKDSGTFASAEFWSKDIRQIDLKKKGSEGSAVLIGGAVGMALGLVVGLLVAVPHGSNDMDQQFNTGKMIVFPLLCTGVGAGIGGMAGGSKIKIPIGGSQAELERNRYRLEGYSIKKHPGVSQMGSGYFSRLKDSLTDIDGNVYHMLALGGQVWMAENLRVTRFRDSTAIPDTSVRKLTNAVNYNWRAIADVRNLCPAGWHVPSQTDWTSLCNSLGGEDNASSALDGPFTPKGWPAQWWASTPHPDGGGCFYVNGADGRAVYTVQPGTSFLPVRCIRDN